MMRAITGGSIMPDTVLVKSHGAVVEVALNRPDSRNALDREILRELLASLSRIVETPDGHVLVLHGVGVGFCAGADLRLMENLPQGGEFKEAFLSAVDTFQQIIHLLATAPRVTVCAMHGFALGAGLDLALACDLRVAASGTQMATSYVRYGLVPDGGGTWALPRLIGLGPAIALLLSGDPVDTEGAYRLGLIHRRARAGRHLSDALAWAEELASRPHAAQVAIKRLARVDPRLTLSAALKEEREAQRRLLEEGHLGRFPAEGSS
jgi:enoyl-CoA hydratase/carnithine racemase